MWVGQMQSPESTLPRCSCELFDKSQPYGDNFHFRPFDPYGWDEQSARMIIGNAQMARYGYKNIVKEGRLPLPGQGPKERLRQEAITSYIFCAEADEKTKSPHKAYLFQQCGPGGMGCVYEATAV